MLSRRWIINYVLIVLILLFTWIGNRYDVQTGFQPNKALSPLRPADIDSIEIQTADESISLRRDGQAWSLQTPIQWPANQVNVARLLEIANAQTESSLPSEQIDLGTLGLDFPRARLQLNQQSILFGTTNNIGDRRYVKAGDTIYLLPDIYLPFVSQGLTGLVDRRLLPRSLALRTLNLPDLTLSRDGDSEWQTDDDRHGEGQAAELIADWQGLEAARVKIYDSSATPRQKIVAQLEDGRELEYFLMSITPEIIIARPDLGLQYHFSDELYYRLIALRDDEDSA